MIFYIKVATCPKETCRLYKILPNSTVGQHCAFQEWICLQNQAPSHEEQHQLGGLRLLTGKKSSSRKDTRALQFPRPWFVTARLYQDVPNFSRQALPFFIWTQLWHLRAAGKPERGKKKKEKGINSSCFWSADTSGGFTSTYNQGQESLFSLIRASASLQSQV